VRAIPVLGLRREDVGLAKGPPREEASFRAAQGCRQVGFPPSAQQRFSDLKLEASCRKMWLCELCS